MTIRWLLIGLGLAAAGHGAMAADFVGLDLAPDARLRAQRFSGNELPILGWCFSADGRRVAFRQGVRHGTDAQHYELRALKDGRRLAVFDTPHDAASAPPAARRLPAWAACTEEP